MSRNEPCFCGSGKKQKRCHADTAPNSRAAEVLRLYGELEQLVNNHYSKPNAQRPPCQEGCAECCYQNFTITEIEYKLIAKELKTWSKERLDKLYTETFRQLEVIEENYPEVYKNLRTDSTLNNSILRKQYKIMGDSYGIPCPLLDTVTGRCEVYNSRPLICRMHGTTYYVPEDYSVCNKISSNLKNAKITYNAVEFLDRAGSWDKIEIRGDIFQTRQYPIVYWLKLLLEQYKLTGKIQIPNEARDFNMSSDTAKRQQVNSIISRM